MVISPTFVPGAIDAYVGFQPMHIALATKGAVSVSNPDAVWPGGYDYGDGLPDLIRIRGGDEIAFQLEMDYDFEFEWPLEVHQIRAVLRVPGEGRRELEARITPESAGTVIVSLPDRDIRGTLTLEVEASDRCLSYTATGVGQVNIVRAATVDACPVRSQGYVAHVAGLLKPPIEVGSVPIRAYNLSILGLWAPYAVSAQGGGPWDRALEPIVGLLGSRLAVAAGDLDLQLTELHATFYRRRDVIDNLESGDAYRPVKRSALPVRHDGSFNLELPGDRGRYVVDLSFRWESSCARGDMVSTISIDVE